MSPYIFWWCALSLLPPLVFFLSPLQLFVGIISHLWGVIILFKDSVIPNQYIWGALTIFLITSLPPVRALGAMAAQVIAGPNPQGRTMNVGDSVIGSISGFIYNLRWLEFANNNQESYLIYLNYLLASIGIWLFVGYAIMNRNSKRFL